MPTEPSSSPALRASDADRDRVIGLLRVRLAGQMKHGRIGARWVAPRQ